MLRPLILSATLLATPAFADVPRVATDIAPVHSLVAQVMQGVGTPELIIPPDASPHDYALRPSEARALSAASLVVTVGPALTPWLEETVDTLAGDARHLALMEVDGMRLMPFREGAAFAHAHDHGHGHDDDHEDEAGKKHAESHDDHAHGDEDHKHEDAHAHGKEEPAGQPHHDGHDGHAHGAGMDPHIWLDPRNGAVALTAVAEALAALDPGNAATYRQNAQQGVQALDRLEREIGARLDGARGRPFIVFHDAYHYFEARFDVEASAAVSAGDAADPGAARIAELRAHVADAAPVCAFAEPQMNVSLLETVVEGQDVRLATIDPLGAALTPGPALYPQLIAAMADSIAGCLTE